MKEFVLALYYNKFGSPYKFNKKNLFQSILEIY